MNQRLALIIFIFAFVVAIVAGFFSPSDEEPTPSDFRAKLRQTLPSLKAPEKTKAEPVKREPSSVDERVSPPSPTAAKTSSSARNDEEAFAKKYGEGLSFSRHEDRIVRIDGTGLDPAALEGTNRVPGFMPSNRADLLARASEILGDSFGMMGMDPRTSFLPPTVEPGDVTGRVTYQQAIDGVMIYPGGTVTVLLGSRGELRALDSSVYPSVRVVNQVKQPPVGDVRKILYVTDSAPVALAHYAYDSREKGIQRVIDAETGDLLLERDRRVR